jgi:hypothetical protein
MPLQTKITRVADNAKFHSQTLEDFEKYQLHTKLKLNLDHNNNELVHDLHTDNKLYESIIKMLCSQNEDDIKLAQSIIFKSKITEQQSKTFVDHYCVQVLYGMKPFKYTSTHATASFGIDAGKIAREFELLNKRLEYAEEHLKPGEMITQSYKNNTTLVKYSNI